MKLAGEYAYAGRDVVVDKVLEILGARAEREVHNHHNFAWYGEHGGWIYWVVRKGCTPARPVAAHGGTIRVKHRLRPLGVAMAGRDVHDPYKD